MVLSALSCLKKNREREDLCVSFGKIKSDRSLVGLCL